MPVPLRIPIKREIGYHTDLIGSHAQGQFLGSVVSAYLGGWRSGMTREDLRWYAVLHHFDGEGVYLRSDIELAGINVEGQQNVVTRAQSLLKEWLSQLDEIVYGDISVRLFQTEYDGILFGLVDESDDERGDHVELYPDGLGFHEPWNGEYDT